MPMIFVTEPQRAWLERLAAAYGVKWLRRAAALEDPVRRGLAKPERLEPTRWRGSEKIK